MTKQQCFGQETSFDRYDYNSQLPHRHASCLTGMPTFAYDA